MDKQITIPQMRTIKQVATEIKEEDPNTKINEYQIRKLVDTKVIPCVPSGVKKLISKEDVIDYYRNRNIMS